MNTPHSILNDVINRLESGDLYELRRGLILAAADEPKFDLMSLESLLDQRQEEIRQEAIHQSDIQPTTDKASDRTCNVHFNLYQVEPDSSEKPIEFHDERAAWLIIGNLIYNELLPLPKVTLDGNDMNNLNIAVMAIRDALRVADGHIVQK